MTQLTEVFVSQDGLNFVKLDLYKNESIIMKYTSKDLQDISKIFSPYSLSFVFPATPKNRMAFGFFGDTDVIKINEENKFPCKVYTDGILNLTGFVQLSDLKYKNNTPLDFTGGFTTSMTNLKDRIGDDYLTDLTSDTCIIDWTYKNVETLINGATNTVIDTVPISYFVPLISNNRVWQVDENIGSGAKDNISWDSLVLPTSNNLILSSELRPCISFSTIIELIKKKYSLQVIAPLDNRSEYKDLMIWCTGEKMFNEALTLLTIKSAFSGLFWINSKNEGGIPDPKKYTVSNNLIDSSFKVTKRASPFPNEGEYTKFFTFKINFTGVVVTGDQSNPAVNIQIKRKGTNETLIGGQFTLDGTSFNCSLQINDTLFIANEVEFQCYAQFNQPTSWTNCTYLVEFKYYDGKTGWLNSKEYATYLYQSAINNNSSDLGSQRVDLIKSLPKTKVVDFLQSYFKMFNISVFDTSPNNENLFWLTPEDIQTSGLEYSKREIDYTPFVDVAEFTKSTPSEYNYYNFKHATSKYKSNVDYLQAAGLEYGQLTNPSVKPSNPKEFKIETSFSIIPPVTIVGTDDIITAYGFNSDSPTINESGETRYNPNFDELTIFYNDGNTALSKNLGYRSTNYIGSLINTKLTSYMKVTPWSKLNQSAAFSILVNLGVSYPINLYSKYYNSQIARLLNPNVLSQAFKLTLPSSEMYLNEATTGQGNGATPTGFRLQNDIVVMENRFTILDAQIDITTGKTSLTLLNF